MSSFTGQDRYGLQSWELLIISLVIAILLSLVPFSTTPIGQNVGQLSCLVFYLCFTLNAFSGAGRVSLNTSPHHACLLTTGVPILAIVSNSQELFMGLTIFIGPICPSWIQSVPSNFLEEAVHLTFSFLSCIPLEWVLWLFGSLSSVCKAFLGHLMNPGHPVMAKC